MGADHGLNYRTDANWDKSAKDITGGHGADIVVETGGSTLHQSLSAVGFGGFVAIIGFVAGYEATIELRQLIGPMARVQGIAVGSRTRFEAMNRAISANGIKPVIDRVFDFQEAGSAFKQMASECHFGKVVVRL